MSEDRVSMVPGAFDIAPSFEAGETSGGIRLGRLEAMYEELFAEVLEDGVITVEERQRLDRAADSMGLDRDRLRRLEAALQTAWESHHNVRIVVQGAPTLAYAPAPPAAHAPAPAPTAEAPAELLPASTESAQLAQLRAEVLRLTARVRQLEADLEAAHNDVAVEVDLGAVAQPLAADDPTDLQRRIRQDPLDPEPMRLLFRWAEQAGKLDEQWCVASALVFTGRASPEERAIFDRHKGLQLPKFSSAVSSDAWRRLLFHPDEELLTGDIFSVITSAVLLGRVSALRRDKLLPKLDPQRRHDPVTSTVSAVRALAWASAILGLKPPPIYVDPELPQSIEMIPGMPPNLRVGAKLLSGRTPLEVAFECGRALASFREEHFVRWLFPGVPDLEDLFLAALSLANPALPIPAHAKARVAPIAGAIAPVLEPTQVDRLRGYFLHFVESGGRTNLQRWAHGVDKTACRAGLVLCNDLATAGRILAKEETGEDGGPGERMRDLLVFACSERHFNLRKQLGVAIAEKAGG